MKILIDNKSFEDYGISVLDYTGALSFAAERDNERIWSDKSGVDRNLENIRYDSKEFVFKCIVKADNEVEAYNLVNTLVQDMYTRGVFVLSLRDQARGIRECYLCERSGTIVGNINIRTQNSLYHFKLGFKDVNPAALKYKTNIVGNESTILYDKGQNAVIYWGNGDRGEVSNSGNYTKSDYLADGEVDIIIDVDADADTVTPLVADFVADKTNIEKPDTVQFTNLSLGNIVIYSWDFGDGTTSSESNPSHVYSQEGVYTVTLQIFNDAQGSDVETKIDYITVVPQELLISPSNVFLINNSGDKLLIN